MFKKTKIAAVSAVILGLSSMAAQASHGVTLNDAGSHGEVLIFPYYNLNNGFITAFNVTNTTDDYKAIKIRFRESENSNDVLDFNLYMSPEDVFTISLTKGSDDGVLLKTTDNTCTHPAIPAGGVLFRHQAYASTDVADVREGYLEVIEMGVIDEEAYILIDDELPDEAGNRQIITKGGILHKAGVPIDCTVIERAWQQGVFAQGGARANTGTIDRVLPKANGYPDQTSHLGFYGQGFTVEGNTNLVTDPSSKTAFQHVIHLPQGGLVGTSILVDTINVGGFVAEPISVLNYSTRAQHYLSSDENFYLLPSLASGTVDTAQASQNEYGNVKRDWGMDDRNVLPRKSVPSGINPMPLADTLLVTSLANQYFLGEGTKTDWVISAPMRKHAIYNDYRYVGPGNADGFTKDSKDIPVGVKEGDIPNGAAQEALAATNGYWLFLDADDVSAKFVYWDREEAKTETDPGDFSPPLVTPDAAVPFEREVNILALNTGNGIGSVLGSVNAQELTLAPGFTNGWGRFVFDNNDYNLNGARYTEWVASDYYAPGVPLYGFMSVLSTLGSNSVGETFPHFYHRYED